ncbi:hypothetical protein DESC_30006 [Desulfosarcina cetonica]|nr:hypothetical protein DESC_30006 [Desulfosarcina cetonica]
MAEGARIQPPPGGLCPAGGQVNRRGPRHLPPAWTGTQVGACGLFLGPDGLDGARGRSQRPGVARHGPLPAPGQFTTHRSLRRGQSANMGAVVSDLVSIHDSYRATV